MDNRGAPEFGDKTSNDIINVKLGKCFRRLARCQCQRTIGNQQPQSECGPTQNHELTLKQEAFKKTLVAWSRNFVGDVTSQC